VQTELLALTKWIYENKLVDFSHVTSYSPPGSTPIKVLDLDQRSIGRFIQSVPAIIFIEDWKNPSKWERFAHIEGPAGLMPDPSITTRRATDVIQWIEKKLGATKYDKSPRAPPKDMEPVPKTSRHIVLRYR
jgi:hypothetical protein